MDWDDEYTLLATSSKGDALDFLNLDTSATTEAETPLSELIRHWMNERHASSILAAQEQLLGLLLDLHPLTDMVQAPFVAIHLPHKQSIFELCSFKQKWNASSLSRARISGRGSTRQIEKYARFITADAEIQTRLTTAEKAYASRGHNIRVGISTTRRFLSHPWPNKSRAMFAYALKECPLVRLSDRATLTLEKDRLRLVPFYVIEHLVERGDAEFV
ncbi:hypothetical protein ARMGADRAFT_1075418 [Armillaria gallica]|uniref:Uncharacterized protein n=1 Tax=Armillaria gallica TaxID=47427 RepID=A0A2H3EB46_ARMGA|nr:hypothetical protein ARMGADRAFT_1075418 [Armillaria gallica]